MRAYIDLIESFTKTVPYSWADHTEDGVGLLQAKFQIGDGYFVIQFIRKPYMGRHWDVSFVRNGERSLTGTGNAMVVLSTVMAAVADFIEAVNPSEITLSADVDDSSRLTLYPKLIERLLRQFPKYRLDSVEDGKRSQRTGEQFRTYQLSRPYEEPAPAPVAEPEPPIDISDMTDDDWDDLDALVAELNRR